MVVVGSKTPPYSHPRHWPSDNFPTHCAHAMCTTALPKQFSCKEKRFSPKTRVASNQCGKHHEERSTNNHVRETTNNLRTQPIAKDLPHCTHVNHSFKPLVRHRATFFNCGGSERDFETERESRGRSVDLRGLMRASERDWYNS